MRITPELITYENVSTRFSDSSLANYLRFLFRDPEISFNSLLKLRRLELSACSGNPDLARLISLELGKNIDPIMEQLSADDTVKIFPDEEVRPQFRSPQRNKHSIIFQSFSPRRQPEESGINDQLVEVINACEAAQRASAGEITVVMPYMAYARSDKKDMPRVGIGAKAMLDSFRANGADRFMAMDIHKDQITGFAKKFDIIYSSEFFLPFLKKFFDLSKLKIVSPDGSDKMAQKWCKLLLSHPENGQVKKYRDSASAESISHYYAGPSVEGMDVAMVDDLIAGGTTIVDAAKLLKSKGAKKIIAVAPHGLMLKDALTKIRDSQLDEVWITNSVRQSPDIFDDEITGGKIKIFNISAFLAKKMIRVHTGKSMEIA